MPDICDIKQLNRQELEEIVRFLGEISEKTSTSLCDAAFSMDIKHRYIRSQLMLIMAELGKRSD